LSPLVLASKSPRRRELLARLGIEFEVLPSEAQEPSPAGESPPNYVSNLAQAKAEEVFSKVRKPTLAADTVVVCEGEILGKPKDFDDALRMLRLLSARFHRVLTAYVILTEGERRAGVVETKVCFKPLAEEEIKAYLATDEPWDKAGAYAIQGIASYMVERVEGSVTNVIGLPLTEVVADLLALKIVTWRK